MKQSLQNRGSILILALWVLAFSGILAAQIGLTLRQRISLLGRFETRSELHYLADAGVKKSIALLELSFQRVENQYPSYEKMYTHNNPEMFKDIRLGRGTVNVSYPFASVASGEIRYGVDDEEGKLNINFIDPLTLKRLIENVVTTDKEEVTRLTNAILDWRDVGKTQLDGFYSDDYYGNLRDSYPVKSARFELFDELMLIKGIDQSVFNRLLPFITIYGDGMVNINTASREVLLSIGMEQSLVDKLLFVRRGSDGAPDTVDDYVFQKTFNIASEVRTFIELDLWEIKQLDLLNKSGRIKIDSAFYRIHSRAELDHTTQRCEIFCIYNLALNKLEYWREKY